MPPCWIPRKLKPTIHLFILPRAKQTKNKVGSILRKLQSAKHSYFHVENNEYTLLHPTQITISSTFILPRAKQRVHIAAPHVNFNQPNIQTSTCKQWKNIAASHGNYNQPNIQTSTLKTIQVKIAASHVNNNQ